MPQFHLTRLIRCFCAKNLIIRCKLFGSTKNVHLNTAGVTRVKHYNEMLKCVSLVYKYLPFTDQLKWAHVLNFLRRCL